MSCGECAGKVKKSCCNNNNGVEQRKTKTQAEESAEEGPKHPFCFMGSYISTHTHTYALL